MVRVFISHKSEDTAVAMWIHSWLGSFGVDAYIDKLDPLVGTGKGGDLGDYFRWQLQNGRRPEGAISSPGRDRRTMKFISLKSGYCRENSLISHVINL